MLLPHEIRKKEFSHSISGYARNEVKSYLEYVAAGFEKLRRENDELSRKLEAACAQLDEYHKIESEKKTETVSAVYDKAIGDRMASIRKGVVTELREELDRLSEELLSIEKLISDVERSCEDASVEEEPIITAEEIFAENGIMTDEEETEPDTEEFISEETVFEEPIPEERENNEELWGEIGAVLETAIGTLEVNEAILDPDAIDGAVEFGDAITVTLDEEDVGTDVTDVTEETVTQELAEISLSETDPEPEQMAIELPESDETVVIEAIEETEETEGTEEIADLEELADLADIDSFLDDFLIPEDQADSDASMPETVFEFITPSEKEPAETVGEPAAEAVTVFESASEKDAQSETKPTKPMYKKHVYRIRRVNKKTSEAIDDEAEALLAALKEKFDKKDGTIGESDESDGFDIRNYDEFNYFLGDTNDKIETVPMNNDINDI